MESDQRYRRSFRVGTNLDKYGDVVGWIEGLRSGKYLEDLIGDLHQHKITDRPRPLASRIVPLVEVALSYINQAAKGPTEVAFLPQYYAMLNLAKIYVMLGHHRHDLEQVKSHRRHGITYDPTGNDQLRLDTQKVTLRRDGVLGLFYRTLTGENWVSRATTLTMANVYPFIDQIAADYQFVTGKSAKVVKVVFAPERESDFYRLLCVHQKASPPLPSEDNLNFYSALKGGHWLLSGGSFVTSHHVETEEDVEQLIDCCVRRELLHHGGEENSPLGGAPVAWSGMPLARGFPSMVEEFPILIAFFYQASLARYKPDFLYRQQNSKFWPLLVALRRHATYTFLLLFWNYVKQESIFIVSE